MTEYEEDDDIFSSMLSGAVKIVVLPLVVFVVSCVLISIGILAGPAWPIALLVMIALWFGKYGSDFPAFLGDIQSFILGVAGSNREAGLHEQWGLENVYPPAHHVPSCLQHFRQDLAGML